MEGGDPADPKVAHKAKLDDGHPLLGHVLEHDRLNGGGESKEVHEEDSFEFAVFYDLLALLRGNLLFLFAPLVSFGLILRL